MRFADPWWVCLLPVIFGSPWVVAILVCWRERPRDGAIPQSMADVARKRLL